MKRASVEVLDASRSYGETHALRQINLRFEPGEVTAIFGPNGAGKSTLIKGISRDGFSTGSAIVEGSLGYVRQRTVIWGGLTVHEQLKLVASVADTPNTHAVDRAIENYGLSRFLDVRGSALSGGVRRRLSTAMALIHQPLVCLLDEPEAGLDLPARAELYALLRRWAQEERVVVFATHHVLSATDVIDRVVMLSEGKVVADGAPTDLLERFAPERRWVLDIEGSLRDDFPHRVHKFGKRAVIVAEETREQIESDLQEQGVLIRNLQARASNLEDVFLEVM